MPAQLDAPSPSPQSPGGQRVGFCSGLSSHPHFFISPVLFVSLALWVGIAATCWLSDSWADCPLTVPSPEQKSRRGSPSICPYLLLSCLWKPLLPLVGRHGPELSSRTALPLSWQQNGRGTPCRQRPALACCYHSCSLPTGLAPLWSFWKVPSQPPVLGWKQGKMGALEWQGQATCPGGSGQWHFLIPAWACSPRLSLGALPFL